MTVLKVALITAEVHGKTSINLNCCWSKPLMRMEAHIRNREGTAILVCFQAFCAVVLCVLLLCTTKESDAAFENY